MAGIVIEYTAVFVHFGREEPGTAGLFLIKGEPQHLRLLSFCFVFRSGILRRLYCKCLSVCIKILVEKVFAPDGRRTPVYLWPPSASPIS